MKNKRYIGFFDSDEQWVFRPVFLAMAHMAYKNGTAETEINQLYIAMKSGDSAEPLLNPLEKNIAKTLSKDLRLRRYAAEVVLMMKAIHDHYGQILSLSEVRSLVVNDHVKCKPNTSQGSLGREIEKGFSKFRDTCHLQAAWSIQELLKEPIETNEENFRKFLERARALETFLDEVTKKANFSWDPWRVPPTVEARNFKIPSLNLSHEEKSKLLER